jgi:CubicO group peptidase (beta-lactamase class C family)
MKVIITFLSSLVFLSACTTKPKQPVEVANPIKTELTALLSSMSDTTKFNGFGVVMVGERGVLYQNGFGWANVETKEKYTENTLQNIASISKTFIGIAALRAQELGKLKIDDPVNLHLPFEVHNPDFPEIPITLRQLLLHTSSITDNEEYMHRGWLLADTNNLKENLAIDILPCRFSAPSEWMSIEDFLKNTLSTDGSWYRRDAFQNTRPGAIYAYSNVGATLAALVIERAVGMGYDKFTTDNILKPLQMNSSGLGLKSIDISKYTTLYRDKTTAYPKYDCLTYPDGAMITSTVDFSKYMFELLSGYLGKGTILSAASYKEYFTMQLKAENFIERSEGEFTDEYNMGLTMGFSSTGNFGHTGGDPGLFSMMFFNPATKTGRYMIVNTDMNDPTAWSQHEKIWSILDDYAMRLK